MSIHTASTVREQQSYELDEDLSVALPEVGKSMEQDAEWCVVEVDGEWRRVRFHDYDELFAVPGLYEKVIYDILGCRSPVVVTSMLSEVLEDKGFSPKDLRVFDLGAGNGMVGEELHALGAEHIVGVDLVKEAAIATERDRPGIYADYHVVDLTDLDDKTDKALADAKFNCLTCVAALGFGDIPAEAFMAAYDKIRPGGWVAFNIKERFLGEKDESGFSKLIRKMRETGELEILAEKRYPHRLGTDRKPLHYIAIIGRKRGGAS